MRRLIRSQPLYAPAVAAGRFPTAAKRVLALLMVGIWTACAGPSKESGFRLPADFWREQTPRSVLRHLKEQQQRIETLAAAFSVQMQPPVPGQPGHLAGGLIFARDSGGVRVRIKALGPFGRLLFDMVQHDGRIQLYVPARKTLYRGLLEGQTGDAPGWAAAFGAMFPDFEALQPAEGADELTRRGDKVTVPLKSGRLILDDRTGRVRRWHREDAVLDFEAYAETSGQPPVPARLRLKSIPDGRITRIRLDQIRVNQPLENAFDFEGYPIETVRDMSELEPSARQ